MRIGHGYDVHRLVEGKDLILGGVKIDYKKGLLGHSDADVLTHAIMDSLLGAAGLGDIGEIFPDTDPKYKDADSLNLLEFVCSLIEKKGFKISNIDATLIAQKPKIKPYINSMIEKLAMTANIESNKINIKATTEEGLGFTGLMEGMSAHAVCLLDESRWDSHRDFF